MTKLFSRLRSRKLILFAVALFAFLTIQAVFVHTIGGNKATFLKEVPSPTSKAELQTTSFISNVVVADQETSVVFPELEMAKKSLQIQPLPVVENSEQAAIIIIIDDVGMNLEYSQEISEFDVPMTLAFLPYAPKVKDFIATALSHNHEAIIHMPMEPIDSSVDAGEGVLKTKMNEQEIVNILNNQLSGLNGISGLNNHMGSKFTQDRKGLSVVMDFLKSKNLYFVDSRTIGNSLGGSVAQEKGVANLDRDVFLDHEENPEFVKNALAQLELKAKEKGYAVAIGHPKKVTIDALRQWIPSAQSRGFRIMKAGDYLKSVSNKEHARLE